MEIEEESPGQAKRTGPATVYSVGLFTAIVSGTVFLIFGLFFMEFGGELCWNSPSGNILSNPSWSCSLRLQAVIPGVGLFSMYSLPYGLTVAWVADRWKFLGNFGFSSAHETTRRPFKRIYFFLAAGFIGAAVLFIILFFLFHLFKLLLIPIMAFVSAILGILIFIDYSRRKVSAGRKSGGD